MDSIHNINTKWSCTPDMKIILCAHLEREWVWSHMRVINVFDDLFKVEWSDGPPLCIVAIVPNYRSRGPCSIPNTTRFFEK
jgi:hypothetical protein